jgi:FkbM family methyltransferase
MKRSWLRRLARHAGKSMAEAALPIAERFAGFRTARGDYLPNRIRMLFNRYEAAECDLMRQYVRPGHVILDIGANIGYLTRFFARCTHDSGRIIAFEPNPLIFLLLQRNLKKFRSVSLYNVGLSASNGDAELFLAGSDHSVASLTREYPVTHVFYQDSGKLESVAVKLAVGDEVLRRIGVGKIDVLKIDVEGWELNVLAGLERTIAASPRLTIFCEFNPAAQQCAGRAPSDLPRWFLDRNFTVTYGDRGQLRPIFEPMMSDFVNGVEPGRFVTLFATRS